ncbi:MAG: hypothetical protein PF495_14675 [Spirochaetales bacterium]|jgi:hypothetical protein|nr:hypothetical protein [Spirochaetales bacterium]
MNNMHEEAAAMRLSGFKWATIGKELGCSPQLAQLWAKKANPNLVANQKAKRDAEVLRLKSEGQDVYTIARMLWLSIQTVKKVFDRAVEPPKSEPEAVPAVETKPPYVNPPKFVAHLERVRRQAFERGKTAQGLRENGMPWPEVARVMNSTPDAIQGIAKRYRAALREE